MDYEKYMKIHIFDILLVLIMIGCIFISGFMVGQDNNYDIVGDTILLFKDDIPVPDSEQEIIDKCKNKKLDDTVFCVKSSIKPFYNYVITNKSHSDISTLKMIGGDCYNYGKLYDRIFKELGFDSQLVYVKANGDNIHVMNIIANSEGYCTVDGLNVNCVEYML